MTGGSPSARRRDILGDPSREEPATGPPDLWCEVDLDVSDLGFVGLLLPSSLPDDQ